jgi:hypothetical protein
LSGQSSPIMGRRYSDIKCEKPLYGIPMMHCLTEYSGVYQSLTNYPMYGVAALKPCPIRRKR